ncbi:MAG TPA: M20 family metallo-hydrolase [Puia sp.]|nr:M20 family metallo-hydrolase [Puia sp.]
MHKERQRAEKIITRIHELASISEDATGITRRYGTAAFLEGARKVLQWMQEAGLSARMDAIGNVRGRWESRAPGARTLVIASHIDTVPNAGPWDGPLGVLTGLDLVENIIQSGQDLPFHVELIAFCDEEGVRYHTTYLGSKVVAGSFERELLGRRDEAGISLEEAIRTIGGNTAILEEEAIAPADWLGYFEIHIEQGPVLYERKIPAALVEAIAGQVRAEVVFKGVAGHAGTVPMELRQDALCGAAEFILELEKLAKEGAGQQAAGEGEAKGDGLVATVGKLQVSSPASNVIPGEVVCSVDLRSPGQWVLARAQEKVKALCAAIGQRRNLLVDWKVLQVSSPVVCDAKMKEGLAAAIQAAGYEPLSLVSGAGHDAVPISAVSPVAMLFVRCFKGISHHPLEDVEMEDLAAVVVISDNFIQQLSATWKYQH